MHRSISLLLLALCFTVGLLAQQTDYSTFWKQIEEAIEQDLPETALRELKKLRTVAASKGDQAQDVKASLYELRLKAEKDPSLTNQLLTEAEQYISQLKASPEKGLMYLMLAETYSIYLNRNSYRISKRSTIAVADAKVLDPMKLTEWSKSNLLYKIDQLVELAFQDTLLLQQRKIGADDAFIVSDTLQFQRATTLYDLMLIKTIDVYSTADYQKNIENWFRRHLNYRRTQPEMFPLVLAELKLYENTFRWRQIEPDIARVRLQVLDSLSMHYDEHPEVIEIVAEKAKLYLQNFDNKNSKRIAYELCTEGIERYPTYPRIQQLFNIQKQIEAKNLHLQAESHYRSGDTIQFTLTATNTFRVKLGLYRIDASVRTYQQHLSENLYKPDLAPFQEATLLESQWVEFEADPDFAPQTRKLHFTKKGYGMYEIRAVVSDVTDATNATQVSFVVTDLLGIRRPLNADSLLVYAIDSHTGKPQNDVKATIYDRRWDGSGKYLLTELGRAVSSKDGRMVIGGIGASHNATTMWLSKGDDQYCWLEHYNHGYFATSGTSNSPRNHIRFFTDRSIYRPGQVLHYKAIAYQSDKWMEKVLADTSLTISLFDANGSLVGSQQLKTNSFGSVAGSFMLPANGLNGNFSLSCGEFRQNIKVEEYKRPTFEVELKTETPEIKFGKSVQLRGKATAYAGYPVSGAKITYTILRNHMHLYRINPGFRGSQQIVGEGNTISGADGSFTIDFVPEKVALSFNSHLQYYNYNIKVDVTAAHGETQQGNTSVVVGERSLILFSTVPALFEKGKELNPGVKVQNLNGTSVDKTVFYELNYIPDDGKSGSADTDEMDWTQSVEKPSVSKKVKQGNFLSSDSLKLNVKSLRSGKYLLQLYTLDETGDTVRSENRIILYSSSDKKPAVVSTTWLPETNLTATPGSIVSIPFGTSLRKAWILFEINHGNTIIQQKWVRQCNSIRNYRIQFDEKYKDGLTVQFTIVQNGKVFVKKAMIKAPATIKEIKPFLTVFRDKLRPGLEEKWTVALSGTNKSTAELVAGMYDASLDMFAPLQWQFSPSYSIPTPRTMDWAQRQWYWSDGRWNYQYPFAEETPYSIANIDFYDVPSTLVADRNSMPILIRGMKASSTKVSGNIEVEDDNVVFAMVDSPVMPEEVTRPTVQLRENFNETAFFYPQLHADTAGLFHINFTLPESLTRWRLKLLAHNRELYAGQSEYTFASQKELMVNMNLPRFIRQSDSWELQASVVNLTDKHSEARVKLHFFNPITEEPVARFSPEVQTVSLEANGQQTVSWKIPALPDYDLVACRIEAQTGEFSDGEQRYLPVLSDRILVTESVPFVVKGDSSTTVELATLPEGTDVKQVSLEFTANPSWIALQALPLLSVPESNTAIDLLGAWYSNAVSLQLLKNNPVLTKVIMQLSASGLTEKTWISQLEKNQDLKMLVLKETPWVTTAAGQTQQQRELIRLLNEQQLQNDARIHLKELSKLQNASGGFSWMAGMPESRYITQLVAEKLQRMASDSLSQQDIKTMLNSALKYLDAYMARDYEQLKKNDKKFREHKTINTLQLHYLTLRSAFPEIEVSEAVVEAHLYYHDQINKYRHSFSIYEKAMAAQYFHRTGQSASTNQMLQSLRELSVNDPLKGMHWPQLKSGWQWDERPLSIHTRILEAFTEVQGAINKAAEIKSTVTSQPNTLQKNRFNTNISETEAMKLWLLNQKQTTHWDNRLTTLEAVMALLTTGESLLSQSPEYQFKIRTTDIQQSLLELRTEPALPGSGYFRQALPLNTSAVISESIPSSELKNNQPTTPENNQHRGENSSMLSRGAVYRQYFQSMDKSIQTGKELTVERSYYLQKIVEGVSTLIELNTGNSVKPGKRTILEGVSTLTELQDGTPLKPGDKIISRMVLKAENDYEYVVLRDTKAAALEAVSPLSGMVFNDGLMYYRNPGDVSINYFFHHLPRGNYVLEESYYLTQTGDFSAGIAEIQCLYAPEYGGKSAGTRISVAKDKKGFNL